MRWRLHLATITVLTATTAIGGTHTARADPGGGDFPGVVRAVDGELHWFLRDAVGAGPAATTFTFGKAGDIPVWGDWNGDGTRTAGVFRAGAWELTDQVGPERPAIDHTLQYGRAGDTPVAGDWDGAGRPGIGVVRGTTWLLRHTVSGGEAEVSFTYGRAGDLPVAGDWDGDGDQEPGVYRAGVWYLRAGIDPADAASRTTSLGVEGDRPVAGDWDGDGVDGVGVVHVNTWRLDGGQSFAFGTPADAATLGPSGPVSDGSAGPAGVGPSAKLTRPAPADDDAKRLIELLRNTNRYGMSTWWQRFAAQEGPYLTFGGVDELQIRPPAMEALGVATALRTGVFDPATAGVTEAEARRRTVLLTTSLVYRHRSNSPGGWGPTWQSTLWAAQAGLAGWLLWDDLSPVDRERLTRMVESEADRFVDYPVPYYRDRNGVILSPGDTKAEENAWNAMALQLAVNLMPAHPHRARWERKEVELMVSAFARPTDLTSSKVLHGKPVSAWLGGSNANDDGFVINHNIVHPDYSTTVSENLHSAIVYSLADRATPQAALFNADVVYQALVDHKWTAGSAYPPGPAVAAPGGTVYVRGSADLYYPQGNDWGTDRYVQPMTLDTQISVLALDGGTSVGGAQWARLHGDRVLSQQRRSADRRTYVGANEDRYQGREELVASTVAQAWLTRWVVAQGTYRLTNAAV
ncbi:hypothetical protein [Actinoplanes sp. NPDC026619]|uniref:hypothetical protein n=1 Tax=Actinoplanes sp. NPDC026619 TaxID=3155798 RepID=UPI0033ED4E6D